MNAKNNTITDPKIDKILMQATWRTLDQIIALANEDNNNKFLNEYRWALSLWAEHTNDTKNKVIVTLDGRDTAWKWSNIKRVAEYFDIKRYEEVAYWIPKPIEKIDYNWFKRYMSRFPNDWEVVFFDRSWYNRVWVEAAMWFCTEEEYNWFMKHVDEFEREQIIDQGIKYIKIYLSITKDTQKFRLKQRESARKRWKSSPIDKVAQEKWNFYTLAKYKILEYTNNFDSPWIVLDSNEKFLSAVEIIKAIINTTDEVSKIVEKDLSIDLSPNPLVRRTASEELEKMRTSHDFDKMKQEFHFRIPTDDEIAYVENFRSTHDFDRETYSYVAK